MTVLALAADDFGAGFIAFLVVLALGIGTFFLLRSMTRHLRKVPASFTAPQAESPDPVRQERDRGDGSVAGPAEGDG